MRSIYKNYFILLLFLNTIAAINNVAITNIAIVSTELSPVAGTASFADELVFCVVAPPVLEFP